MKNSKVAEYFILGLFILLGLSALGYFISKSAVLVKSSNRFVTVKGLAEKEVAANIAIWPISFNETANDLIQLYEKINLQKTKVLSFLKDQGFSENEISLETPFIKDLEADVYLDNQRKNFRYLAKTTITVHTSKVDKVLESITKITDLIKSGVAISGSEYENNIQYLYTKLNDIKPQMIEEATKNGREVAEKFAKDSGSKLGKIKNASQGIFSIDDRDSSTPYIKNVRIVSTIDYYLTDE
ncbi:MAG: SIMPL domain-containing protein [Thermodesulfobacteriota bacterium]